VLPIGKAKIMRPGKHVTLVTFSKMVGYALKAAEELAGQGIDAEVGGTHVAMEVAWWASVECCSWPRIQPVLLESQTMCVAFLSAL
jgi:hypothetical protein